MPDVTPDVPEVETPPVTEAPEGGSEEPAASTEEEKTE